MKEYTKKFSFGISLNISIEEYNQIIKKYQKYISSVYFSLPFGKEFHTREGVIKEYEDIDAKEKLIDILELFKNNNIRLEAIVNQYNIPLEKIETALNALDKEIEIDSICCLDEYINIIKRHYHNKKYLISSFNNEILTNDKIRQISKEYNMVVLGRGFIRNPIAIERVKKQAFEIKLLLNNGCSFNCYSCRAGKKMCVQVFKEELINSSAEELYAKQSFFPWELKQLVEQIKDANLIKEFKISNRPCTYEYLDKCLESYIFCKNEEEYIRESYRNYHLWGRQSNITPYFKEFDINKINSIKQKLWQNVNNENTPM